MGACEARTITRQPIELGDNEPGRSVRDEHRRRVDDVLARRAEVDGIGSPLAGRVAERADERLGRIAHGAPFLHESPRVVEVDATHIRDLRGGLLRDETDGGARRRERAFRFEHAHEPRAFRDCVAQLHGDEDRRERGHTAKNVV